MPVDYADYAPNWFSEIRPAILRRAGGRCEGSPRYPDCRAEDGQPHPVTGSRVSLAVAHLDHDRRNDDPTNLRALCQRCHLAHDVRQRAGNRKRTMMAQDNSTFEQKVTLRREALKLLDQPVVMETHGGVGKIYEACYLGLPGGVVFERNGKRAGILAAQRPTWAVYEADSVRALKLGAGGHLTVNLLDLDPYGSPWEAIEAFLTSDRPKPDKLVIVVNDGLLQKVRTGGARSVGILKEAVTKYGNDLWPVYLNVCEELLQQKATLAGYRLDRFWGYQCGKMQQMAHYLAEMVR